MSRERSRLPTKYLKILNVKSFVSEILKQSFVSEVLKQNLIRFTHICPVDILINRTSPFPVLGVSGVHFQFYLILMEIFVCKQCRP